MPSTRSPHQLAQTRSQTFAEIGAAKATATGSRSTIYGSVFHHFDKITEVYFAADYLKLKDGYKVGVTNGAPNQTEFGMGLRTRF